MLQFPRTSCEFCYADFSAMIPQTVAVVRSTFHRSLTDSGWGMRPNTPRRLAVDKDRPQSGIFFVRLSGRGAVGSARALGA
jgi:hypothetical protein